MAIPIVLDVDKNLLDSQIFIEPNIALRDHEGFLIATIEIEEIWEADKKRKHNVYLERQASSRSEKFI